jgi:hypothetical protein
MPRRKPPTNRRRRCARHVRRSHDRHRARHQGRGDRRPVDGGRVRLALSSPAAVLPFTHPDTAGGRWWLKPPVPGGRVTHGPIRAAEPMTSGDRCETCHFGYPDELAPGAVPTGHVEIHVEVGAWCAGVDEDVAPLVAALWQHGVVTTDSCQDDPRREGEARIGRGNVLDAEVMAEKLTGDPPKWADVDLEWTVEDAFGHRVLHGWDWRVVPMPSWDDEKDDFNGVEFGLYVFIPRTDLAEATARLEASPT